MAVGVHGDLDGVVSHLLLDIRQARRKPDCVGRGITTQSRRRYHSCPDLCRLSGHQAPGRRIACTKVSALMTRHSVLFWKAGEVQQVGSAAHDAHLASMRSGFPFSTIYVASSAALPLTTFCAP